MLNSETSWVGRRFEALLRPVLDLEPRNPPKLPHIVGDQRQPKAAGVRRDERFVRSDERPTYLERRSNLTIIDRRIGGVVKHLNMAQKELQCRSVSFSSRRNFHAVSEPPIV